MQSVLEIAKKLGIAPGEAAPYGGFAVKVSLKALSRLEKAKPARLVLVTSMTPTTSGEGKTTTTIGLSDALNTLGKKSIATLRQPSMGPVFGMKGGATGGGNATVIPPEEINLNFTGDIHAVTAAHNLLSALLANHVFQGNRLEIDEKAACWPHAIDMNARELREGFVISAASEVMAVLGLASGYEDLKKRLARIVVAFNRKGKPVTAGDLKAEGAMAALLKHALEPNMVQSKEGNPVFIHGGPFANIAHGTNSVVATRMALGLAGEKGFVVTESGFGSDLGAEKFVHIVSPVLGAFPSAAVVVVTQKAIRAHGIENLEKHVENLKRMGLPVVVALNKFSGDSREIASKVKAACEKAKAGFAQADYFAKGSAGGLELAEKVVQACSQARGERDAYSGRKRINEKIEFIAKEVYGAASVDYSEKAREQMARFEKLGFGSLPVCMAKTQYSLSDDKNLAGRPKGFKVTVGELRLSAGAGFVVAVLGKMLLMPGLPKEPAAEKTSISSEGVISGLS